MKERQRIAYEQPVTKPFNMLQRRFAKDFKVGKLRLSSILTLSLMGGESSWHVSISKLDRRYQPIPIGRVSEADRDVIREQLDELLEGVGVEDKTTYTESESAFHLMRPLTDEELSGLSGPQHQAHNN
jgi:hypothetical protein